MFKNSAIVTAIMLYSPILLGLMTSLLVTSPRFLVVSTYCVGMLLFLFAKGSNLAKGKWISFGPAGMSKNVRLMYYTGYALMALALAISAAMLFGT